MEGVWPVLKTTFWLGSCLLLVEGVWPELYVLMLFISIASSKAVALFLSILVEQNVDFYIAMFVTVLTTFWRGVCHMSAT